MIDNLLSATGLLLGLLTGLAYVAFVVARMFYIGFFLAIVRITLAK